MKKYINNRYFLKLTNGKHKLFDKSEAYLE